MAGPRRHGTIEGDHARSGFLEWQRGGRADQQDAGELAQVRLVTHERDGFLRRHLGEPLEDDSERVTRRQRVEGLDRNLTLAGLRQDLSGFRGAPQRTGQDPLEVVLQPEDTSASVARAADAARGEWTSRIVRPALGISFPGWSVPEENDAHGEMTACPLEVVVNR